LTNHWRTYEQRWPDPDRETALRSPVSAFPSWFFMGQCSRCGTEKYLSQLLAVVIAVLVDRLKLQRKLTDFLSREAAPSPALPQAEG